MARNVTDMVFKLYGHDETASKALKGVGKEAETVGDKFKHFGKVAGAGFLAVGAAAGAFAADAVHAAMKVEAQNKQLDIALKNNAHATAGQTAAVKDYLEKVRLQYGISNEKLIPSFSKLTRATGDVTKSQNLLKLAMDISAATGKPLELVSQSLSKAYLGNLGALTRLGVPLDKNIIKSKDFNAAVDSLSKTFQGSADGATKTFSGKMAILTENFNAAKEKVGTALLPILTKLADYVVQNIVPAIQAFVDGLTGSGGVESETDKAHESVRKFGEGVRGVFKWISDNKGLVEGLAAAFAAFWAVGKIAAAVSAITGALKAIRVAMGLTKTSALEVAVAEDIASEGTTLPFQLLAGSVAAAAFFIPEFWDGKAAMPNSSKGTIAAYAASGAQQQQTGTGAGAYSGPILTGNDQTYMYYGNRYTYDKKNKTWLNPAGVPVAAPPGAPTHHASGGAVSRGTAILVGENGPELFTPTEGGSITPNNRVGGMGMNVVVNVSGSVIHERDLAVTVRDHIAQLMRRRGLDPAILGV